MATLIILFNNIAIEYKFACCVVTTGTTTSITWLRNSIILNINADSRLTNGDVPSPSLSISNVQQSDSNYCDK
jgi:hypothetical protein